MISDAEWERLENEHWDEYEAHVDTLRIRGFALALDTKVSESMTRLDKSIAAFERARKKAEQEMRAFVRTCEFAENAAKFAARVMAGDVDEETRRAIATLIEEAIG